MTLSNLVATGSGRLAIRWEIEGFPIQFCTEPAMEQTLSDGRRRICVTSLEDCGFVIDEAVNIPDAMLEGMATELRLWETLDEDLAAVFHFRPDVERFGAVTFDEFATSIQLYSTTGISAGDIVHVGTEAIKVAGVTSTSLDVTGGRGYWGSLAVKHWAGDAADVPDMLLTNRPLRARGRRVSAFFYGDDDDPQGGGSRRWRGLVNAEPVLLGSGAAYRLSLGPISDVLKSKLGSDLEAPTRPRGAYYHRSAALRIHITEWPSAGGLIQEFDHYVGFSEGQVPFAESLTTWLQSGSKIALVGFDSTYSAEVTEDGTWSIRVTVGSGTSAVSVWVHSEQDGETSLRPDDMRFDSPDGPAVETSTLAAGDVLYPLWTSEPMGARVIPRGYYGFSPNARLKLPAGLPGASFGSTTVYVAKPVDTSWTLVTVAWPVGTGVAPIASVDAAANSIVVAHHTTGGDGDYVSTIYNARQPAEIRIQRELIDGAFAGFGTVAQLRNALVKEAVSYGDIGSAPMVTTRDLADWTGVAHAEAVLGWQSSRRYYISSPTPLDEYLSHEFRALAVYPVTDVNGKIAIKALDVPNPLTATTFVVDEEIETVDGQAFALSSMVRGNQTVNRVILRTGYDALEDDFLGPTLEVSDRTAYALDHQDRPLTIEPLGVASVQITVEDLAALSLPVLSLFGYPYEIVPVKVTWRAFDVRLGDTVSFAAEHLPNYVTGQRPMSALATVVGRRWAVNEAHGELTVLLSWQNVAGYAPTARVASQVEGAGNLWDLVITSSHLPGGGGYSPGSGTADESHFAAGDKVRIHNIDTETAAVVTGTVVTVTLGTSTIRVQFDATWTPGSATWELIFDVYSICVASQKDYAFFAGTDLLLGTGDAGRTLGP